MKARVALALLAVLMSAGCGSTVAVSRTSTIGGPTAGLGPSGGAAASSAATLSAGGSPGAGLVATGGTPGSTHGVQTGGVSTGRTMATTGGPVSGGPTPVRGAARVTTPLKVGVLTVDLGAAVQALGGGSPSGHASNEGYKALIKAYNTLGGLSGRKIVPTYYVIDATDSSYDSDAAAGCAAFAEAKVEVVITDAASTDYGLAACLAQKGLPLLSNVASSIKGYARAPWVFNAYSPSYDRGYGAVVDQLVRTRYLTPASKTGVIRISCAEINEAYTDSVLPRMRAAHLPTPIEYTVQCATGFQDAGAYSAAMQSAVLRFRSSGVDRVFVMGSQENLLLQYFAEQAQQQGYFPGYAVSSATTPAALVGASTFPAQQLPQVHGAGWHATGDTGVITDLPSEKRCKALAAKGGTQTTTYTTAYVIYGECSNMFLLEAVVAKGNGLATGPELRAVVPTLGTSFTSTGIPSGATLFGPSRPDGPQLAAPWGYVSSCTCFRYSAAPDVMR